MKFLFMLALLALGYTVDAQTKVQIVNGKYVSTSKVATTTKKVADSVVGTYVDKKGVEYPVYKSVNDKLYIIRTSKTGNVYKQYLKL